MNRNKLIIFSILIIVVIAGTTIVAIRLIKKDDSTNNSPETSQTDSPETPESQGKKGDEAFKSAMTAYNSGNVNEAKKQLDLARSLYKSAGSEQGIANVDAQYPLLESAPPKPTQTSAGSQKQ